MIVSDRCDIKRVDLPGPLRGVWCCRARVMKYEINAVDSEEVLCSEDRLTHQSLARYLTEVSQESPYCVNANGIDAKTTRQYINKS
jgi:hypothetical protein